MTLPRFRHIKSREELEAALDRALRQLRRSLDAYLVGAEDEAERIAVAVYSIVKEAGSKGSHRPILQQLGLLHDIDFVDSSRLPDFRPNYFDSSLPLCILRIDGYAPALDSRDPLSEMVRLGFSRWWEQRIYRTQRGLQLSRKNLVHALRNQDGAGHVDPEIRDESYFWLKSKGNENVGTNVLGGQVQRGGGITISTFSIPPGHRLTSKPATERWSEEELRELTNGVPLEQLIESKPVTNGHWASMAQIGWELSQSLQAIGR